MVRHAIYVRPENGKIYLVHYVIYSQACFNHLVEPGARSIQLYSPFVRPQEWNNNHAGVVVVLPLTRRHNATHWSQNRFQ